VVALEARKAAETRRATAGPDYAHHGGRVVILAEHRLAGVPADTRPLPSVEHYNSLLGRETLRRHTVTEQVATAAIEQGCRILRMPTVRDRFTEIARRRARAPVLLGVSV
jgi:hypothetical protein